MTEEQMEELKQDAVWQEYLDAKDMAANFEQDEPEEGENE